MPDADVAIEIEKLLADHPKDQRTIERALLEMTLEELPDAVVHVDAGDEGLIAIGTGRRMSEVLFAIIAHRDHVNLQLADGVDLPDRSGIVEGTGKRVRHVKVRSPEDLERLPLRDLVRAQVALRSR